jgi:hypothetical protein
MQKVCYTIEITVDLWIAGSGAVNRPIPASRKGISGANHFNDLHRST